MRFNLIAMTQSTLRKAKLSFAGAALVVAALLQSCSSSAPTAAKQTQAQPAVRPGARAIESASADFALGREAALAGDAQCAEFYFSRAFDTVRPQAGEPPAGAELAAFSMELYEGILRYEALAAPPEDSATAENHVSPELQKIETPIETTEEAISEAASAIASDTAGVTYDLPIVVNEGVLKILATFQHDLHDIIGRGLARSGRYMPMIHKVFAEAGIPRDLAQVALIESSFIPHAHSRATAHGIWQFMPRTGRQYGLTSNAVIDERSDPEKATRAAARHLAYLHEIFKDWYLALAAYNAGEGRVLRAMEKTGLTDFWQLAASGVLKPQTQNYVPAVIAATLISKNPAHYGFTVDYEKPLEYETVVLDRPVRLRHLSAAEKVSFEDLQQLNPELRTEVTPRLPDGYVLKVPAGTVEAVRTAYSEAPTARPPQYRRHVARRGETIASVARRYRLPAADVASANSLSVKTKLRKGQVLVIPKPEAPLAVASNAKHRKGKKATGVEKEKAREVTAARSYRVRGGDTLYRIAVKNGTTVERLRDVNRLSAKSAIKPGDKLRLPS